MSGKQLAGWSKNGGDFPLWGAFREGKNQCIFIYTLQHLKAITF